MAATVSCHTVLPLGPHTHTIILLHGRDSTAAEFASEFFESQATDKRTLPEIYPTLKWVFPTTTMKQSERFQIKMSQWFDMWSVENPDERKELQVGGLNESITRIQAVVEAETRFVPREHIILGGISQGCATAIHTVLAGGIRLGAFIGFCGWFPFHEEVEQVIHNLDKEDGPPIPQPLQYLSHMSKSNLDAVRETPVFLAHCTDDEVVPIVNGHRLVRGLRSLGLEIVWKEYEDGGHWINEPQGVDDVVAFISKAVKGTVEPSSYTDTSKETP